MSLGLLNVRSLNTGQDELLISIEKYKPDILALNETWLKQGEEKCAPKVSNYIFKHRPRTGEGRGGGVGYYVRRGLRVRALVHPESSLEQMWLEVLLAGGVRLAVGTAYRPESVTVDIAISALSESVSSFGYCDYVFVLTDFNVDILQTNTSQVREVLAFLAQHRLEQVVKEATRVTADSSTLLDLVITDAPTLCKRTKVYHNPCLSDHALVISDFYIKKPKLLPRTITYRPLNQIDESLFQRDLFSVPWSDILLAGDVNEMVKYFDSFITTLFNKHAHVKRFRVKEAPHPWLTDNVRLMINIRNKALVKARSTKMLSHMNHYKEMRNFVNSSIKREKQAYFTYYVNNNIKYPAKMWQHLKRFTPFGNTYDIPVPEHLNCPDLINDSFLNIPGSGHTDLDNYSYFINNKFGDNTFEIMECSEDEILKIITSVKTKAHGDDLITIDMILMTLPVTLPIITGIVNKSISSKVFPEAWKLARVKPLPKGSNIVTLKDLRPISVLPVMSKFLERAVCIQLTKYLEENSILPTVQSGFRSGHSTTSALTQVTDDILSAADKGRCSILVLLDFSRAFDCINKELLISKMAFYGLSVPARDWFMSYLTERKQYVLTENGLGEELRSNVKTVSRGTPQGSIISPLLFILFTADLNKQLKHCHIHLYADDTQVYLSFDPRDTYQASKLINEDLDSIYKWAHKNNLVLNPDKSKYLILGTKQQRSRVAGYDPNLFINGKLIERVETVKNLGLLMDGEMRFIDHVNIKIRNAFFRLKVLYGIRNHLTEKVRLTLVESLVLSLFNYCDTVYGPRLYAKTAQAIQRVQNACTRFCFSVSKRSRITPILNEMKILKMAARRELHLAGFVHNIVITKKPEYLFKKIKWQKDSHDRHTRSKILNKMSIPQHRTAGFRGSFKFSASKIWNDLPPPLRTNIMSLQAFKNHLRVVLINKQIETVADS